MGRIIIVLFSVFSITPVFAAAPVADFSGTPTTGTIPVTVSFHDLSSGSPTGWAWFFGDEDFTQPWIEVNASAEWPVRRQFGSVALPNGSIVLMGGDNAATPPTFYNETWISGDYGDTWSLANASSGWKKRSSFCSVALPDGTIALMGGYDGYLFNDTWTSTNYGTTWTEVNTSSGWEARIGSTCVALPDGTIALMGGWGEYGSDPFNDTWISTDYGTTWAEVNISSGWEGRFGSTSVVLPDGSIVLMGGNNTISSSYNDVWRSTDRGSTWMLMNASAGWAARQSQISLAMPDGTILLMGGIDGDSWFEDVWQSKDKGETWIEANATAGWSPRACSSGVLMNDGSVAIMGGHDYGGTIRNDVWRFSPAGSTIQNPSHDYTTADVFHVTLQAFNTDGYNSIRKAGYISATAPTVPVAGFTANITFRTSPLAVQFTDTSTNTPTKWNWSFGDGTFSNTRNATHTYPTVGSYEVSLNASNAAGSNILTRSNYITVTGPKPVADFSGSPLSGPAPLGITFTDLSSNVPAGWAWFFGDEKYTEPWVEVTDSPGWSDRYDHTCVAMPDGSIVLMGGYDGTMANDTWRSTDNGYSWTRQSEKPGWIGREALSSVVLPDSSIVLMGGREVVYTGFADDVWRSTDMGISWTLMNATPGWDARGWQSSVAMPDGSIVLMGGHIGSDYRKDVWKSTDKGATWSLVNATAEWDKRWGHTSVVTQDGNILLMGGSGFNDTWRSNNSGVTWTLMNGSPGWEPRYGHNSVIMPDGSIILMGGVSGSLLNDVWRSTDDGATWSLVNASAGWSPQIQSCSVVLPGGDIILTGGSGDMGILTGVWKFQPTGSSIAGPGHSYSSPGIYSVVLQAFNTGGSGVARKTGYITVSSGSAPVADFTATPVSGIAPLVVRFNDTSTNTPISWNWTFGDGGTSTEQNVTHTYSTPGQFNVYLNASNAGGYNSTMKTSYISVSDVHADFTWICNATVPYRVDFHNTSTTSYPPFTSLWWDFGDGTTDMPENASPMHTYTSATPLRVNLTVWDSLGGGGVENSTYKMVTPCSGSGSAPVAGFTGNITSGTAPLAVRFTDSSTNTPASWYWTFGDGGTSTLQSPSYTYSSAGTYSVSLNATNAVGSNTSTRTNYISVSSSSSYYTVAPVINRGASVYMGEQGLNVTRALNGGSPNGGNLDATPVNTTIGWWAPMSVIDVDAPTKTVDMSARYRSLLIDPADFAGYTGSWYVLNGSQTAQGPTDSAIFTVVDPSLDLNVWDFTSGTAVSSGSAVPRSHPLGFRIATNMNSALDALGRSPIYNDDQDGYIDIRLRNPAGTTLTGLEDSGRTSHPLLRQNVSVQPWTWGNAPSAPASWAPGVRDGSGSYVYPGGTYTTWAESGLNNMRSNYRISGADYTGKTVSPSYTITLTNPTTTTTTVPSSGGGYSGDESGPSAAAPAAAAAAPAAVPAAPAPQVAPLQQQLAPPAALPANNPGIAAPVAAQSYPLGFTGLSFNANGQNALSIDMADARAAGATVTTYFDHVDVYQHHSPGVHILFWGDRFDINNGKITGNVSRAEFITDPMNATLAFGNISGSVRADLPGLTRKVSIDTTIPGNVSTDTINQFQDILDRSGLRIDTIAYTLNVKKANLTTGPANVTMTVPASWVNLHGGKESVRITRISDETGQTELLNTVYTGLDSQGNMIFRGDSPHGTSLFGLVTAQATAAEQKSHPNVTYIPASKSAMVTNVGMFGWLIDLFQKNPEIIVVVVAILAAILYFGWWRRRL